MRKFGAAIAAVVLMMTAAGCGGDDTKRPSVSEIEKKLTTGDDLIGLGTQLESLKSTATAAGLDASALDDVSTCVAKVLEKSDLSNKALVALIDGDKLAKVDKDDEKAVVEVATKTGKCISDAGEKLTGTP